MKVLLDTNVVLDILLKREQFFTDSLNAVELALGSGENKGYLFIPASTITDIYYIANRNLKNREKVKELIRDALTFAKIADVTKSEIISALDSEFSDFEDAVINDVAVNYEVDIILTRNKKDCLTTV